MQNQYNYYFDLPKIRFGRALKKKFTLPLRFPKISKIKISKRLFCSYYVNNEIIKFAKFTENLGNFYQKVLNYWCVWSFSVNKISHIWNSKSMEQNMGWFSKKKKKKKTVQLLGWIIYTCDSLNVMQDLNVILSDQCCSTSVL